MTTNVGEVGQAMRTILVIDDNPLHIKLFAEILRHHSYRVILASDGAEGLALARRESPDLMIVDCYLRSAHALDIVRAVRADDVLCRTPIIATSAFADEDERTALRALQCVAYVPKPVSIGPFIATVESALNGAVDTQQCLSV
jgi:two-component system cell cycle response regulator DivK